MNNISFTEMNTIEYQESIKYNRCNTGYSFIISDYQDIIKKRINIFFEDIDKKNMYKNLNKINAFLNFLIKYKNYIIDKNKEEIFIFYLFNLDKNKKIFLKEIFYLAKIDLRDIPFLRENLLSNKNIFIDQCDLDFQSYLEKRSKELIQSKNLKINIT